MSKLEKVILSMVEVFEEYKSKDVQRKTLTNAEFSELIKRELASDNLKGKIEEEEIKEAIEKIDKNHDGEVNFREFSQCVSALAKGYYKKKHGKGKKEKDAAKADK
ncbi:S100 calcium binding protein W [Hoplias malabaricus]|uniref:S100 calcium binding protein W n=1 Tax=Hoplias malabaricus TaxID=27720 RepID=UPI003462A923